MYENRSTVPRDPKSSKLELSKAGHGRTSADVYPEPLVADVPASTETSAPVAVILDSNAMWNQWWLTGASWEELRDLAEQQRVQLYVPEVVVQEVVRGRRHDAHDLVRQLVEIKLARIEPDELAEVSPQTVAVVAISVAEVGSRLADVESRIEPEETPKFERPTDAGILAALSDCIDVIVAGVEPPTPGRWGTDLADGGHRNRGMPAGGSRGEVQHLTTTVPARTVRG